MVTGKAVYSLLDAPFESEKTALPPHFFPFIKTLGFLTHPEKQTPVFGYF